MAAFLLPIRNMILFVGLHLYSRHRDRVRGLKSGSFCKIPGNCGVFLPCTCRTAIRKLPINIFWHRHWIPQSRFPCKSDGYFIDRWVIFLFIYLFYLIFNHSFIAHAQKWQYFYLPVINLILPPFWTGSTSYKRIESLDILQHFGWLLDVFHD